MPWSWFSFIIGLIALPILIAIGIGLLVFYVNINKKIEEKRKHERILRKHTQEENITREIKIISRNELKSLIDKKENYVLIDVRNPEELQHGMIPTARNIPLQEIEHAFDLSDEEFNSKYSFVKPKKDDNIIFYCRTGGRSNRAAKILLDKGFNAKNYKGSIWDWAEIDANVKRYV